MLAVSAESLELGCVIPLAGRKAYLFLPPFFPAVSLRTSCSARVVLLRFFFDFFLMKSRWAARIDLKAATAREC